MRLKTRQHFTATKTPSLKEVSRVAVIQAIKHSTETRFREL